MNGLKPSLFTRRFAALALFLPGLLILLSGGCDLVDNSMVEYFEDNIGVTTAIRAAGKTATAIMEGGIILIPSAAERGPTEIGVELSNPRNFTVPLALSNSTEAGGHFQARQTGPSEIVVRIEGAVQGEDYELTLQMQSPDGLRDFEPYVLRLKCVSFETSLFSLNVDGGAVSLNPPFDPNITSYVAQVPFGTTGVTLAGTVINPAATLIVDGSAGTSKAVGPLELGSNLFDLLVRAENGVDTQTYTVNVYQGLNDSKTLLSFGITSPLEAPGTINEEAKTIRVDVPYGTDLTAMTPVITHTGVSIDPVPGAAQDFSGPVNYTVTAADGTTAIYTVTVNAALNPAKTLTAFVITSPVTAEGRIDEEAKTVSIDVPYGTDLSAMTATVTHTGASVYPASEAAVNFTGPVSYTVTAADGGTQAYTVGVTVQGQGTVSLVFTGPADENINLTNQPLNWKDNTLLSLSVSGSYASYRWYLDGSELGGETAGSLNRTARDFGIGSHNLGVQVEKNGIFYSKEVRITVTPGF